MPETDDKTPAGWINVQPIDPGWNDHPYAESGTLAKDEKYNAIPQAASVSPTPFRTLPISAYNSATLIGLAT